jgi:hypothetical protein
MMGDDEQFDIYGSFEQRYKDYVREYWTTDRLLTLLEEIELSKPDSGIRVFYGSFEQRYKDYLERGFSKEKASELAWDFYWIKDWEEDGE